MTLREHGKTVETCCVCDATVVTYDEYNINEQGVGECELVPHKLVQKRSKYCKTVMQEEYIIWECPHCKTWNAPEDNEEE